MNVKTWTAMFLICLCLSVTPYSPAQNANPQPPALSQTSVAGSQADVASDGPLGSWMLKWKEYVITFVGLPLSVVLALFGAYLSRRSDRKRLENDQIALLAALRSEISAVLYSLYYLSENITVNSENGKYRVLEGASYQGFPVALTIYTANAARVGPLTARAYGMLATYYTKCRETVGRFQHELRTGSISEATRNALYSEAGHGALIRLGLAGFQRGELTLRLSLIPEQDFEDSLKNWRPAEAAFLREGRRLWQQYQQ